MAAMDAVLDQMAGQMEALQNLYTQSDITRVMVEDKIDDLTRAISPAAGRRLTRVRPLRTKKHTLRGCTPNRSWATIEIGRAHV